MHDSRDAINNMTATTYEFTTLDIIDKQNRFFALSELRKGEKIYIKITEQKLFFDPTTVKKKILAMHLTRNLRQTLTSRHFLFLYYHHDK